MEPGIVTHCWTDPVVIDKFVKEAKSTVDSLFEVVMKIK